MIGIIFLVVLLSTLWTAVFVLSLPWVIALVPTLAVVATAVGIFVYRRFQARKAAREIERTLKAQGDDYAKQVRPDQQPEIEAMQSEFAKAVASLKSSKLARGGSDALSVLPWYMIMGPPGVGKSTALRNSGLQFPYLSARGGGVRGVGGTRNCEWWLTNEAVILDTAGRYTTEDDDRDEWFAFLDMLGKNRPKKPVNGLLVAVSVGDFVDLDEEAAGALGQRIRERVDEVMARLKMLLPVYVMFTKCDLLAGFIELFCDMPKSERAQIWGSTEPVTARSASASEIFGSRFDELAAVIQQRALQRVGQTRRLEDRERIFQFPAQFEGLRDNLTAFVRTLFAENVYQDTPVVRGFYFSSATQEGKPIDRMMNAMASAFGIGGALPSPSESARETKSYFLQDFFGRVLFKDQALAMRSTKESQRQGVLQYAYAAGGFGLAALLMLFPTISFFQNRALLQKTRVIVTSVQSNRSESGNSALSKLDPLREELDDLLTSGHSLFMGFGMYQGNNVLESTSGFYATSVRRVMVERVLEDELPDLQGYVDRQTNTRGDLSPKEGYPYFEKLKLYLLLSAPRDLKAEPALDDPLQAWASKQLAAAWVRKTGGSSNPARLSAESHAALYLKLLSQDPTLGVERREPVVASARKVLRRLPIVLEKMIREASGDESDVVLANLLDTPVLALKGNGRVRGAFTKKAYLERFCHKFEDAVKNSDAWVVGTKDVAEVEQLRASYFAQYKKEWMDFLESLSMEGASDERELSVLLDSLTKGDPPPLAQLFRKIALDVTLTTREKSSDDKSPKATFLSALGAKGIDLDCHEDGEKGVEEKFEGFVKFGAPPVSSAGGGAKKATTQLDLYQDQLAGVKEALKAQQGVSARVDAAIAVVKAQIQNQDLFWRRRLEALLMPPLEGTRHVDVQKKSGEISQKWCSDVYTPFKKNLANRYPFTHGTTDASLADVADFFRPNGTLWGFYGKELEKDVPRLGEGFTYAKGLGADGPRVIRREVLTFLRRAQDVKNALFVSNSQDPQVGFKVHYQPTPKVAWVKLTIDGNSVELRNGPDETSTMKWPGTGKGSGASLVVASSKGPVEQFDGPGDWGLFRLLEQGDIRPGGRGSFTVAWHSAKLDTNVVIDFTPTRNESPFGILRDGQKPRLLQAFRDPGISPPFAAGTFTGGCTK